MRAIQLNEFNGPLTLVEVERPTPGEGEVLLEVHYAAVNPLDVWVTQGNFAAVTKLPHIPGVEAVGTMNGRMVLVRGNGIGVSQPNPFIGSTIVSSASTMICTMHSGSHLSPRGWLAGAFAADGETNR